MTVVLSVVIGIALVLLIGYLLIFKGFRFAMWVADHPLAAIFIIVVVVPMVFVSLFLILGLLI